MEKSSQDNLFHCAGHHDALLPDMAFLLVNAHQIPAGGRVVEGVAAVTVNDRRPYPSCAFAVNIYVESDGRDGSVDSSIDNIARP